MKCNEKSALMPSLKEKQMARSFAKRFAKRLATIAASAAVACAFAGAASAAYAADAVAPLDPDATPQQQYYLYGPEYGGANVLAAWELLEGAGISTDAKVDVAVLDTGVYMMRSADSIEEYREANGMLNPALFHQEFNLSNLDTAHSGDFIHLGTPGGRIWAYWRPVANDYVEGLGGNPGGDDNGHGTHIAGIIAAQAVTDAAADELPIGMAGVSPWARVLPHKVLDANEDGEIATIIKAYDYLIKQKTSGNLPNLHVINLSMAETEGAEDPDEEEGEIDDSLIDAESGSGTASSKTWDDLHEAIIRATDAGIVTVCAAGNDSSEATTYPGDFDECICVTALDPSGTDAAYSNINGRKDISAPGTDIYSAWAAQADAYATKSGTSQACAVVSGVLSMLWAANPNLTVDQAREAICNTARTVPGASESNGSYGAIDAAAAVSYVLAGSWRGLDENPRNTSIADAGSENGGYDPDDPDDPDNPEDPNDPDGPEDPGDSDDSADGENDGNTGGKTGPALVSLSKSTVKLTKATLKYTGKALKPAVTVTLGGKKLVSGTDFTVDYKANKNPGKATVTITGKGTYTGTKSATFKIKLGTTKISKLKAAKRAITVKWKRQKSGKVGYQIRYSTKKSMKGAKIRTVKKNAKTSLKLTKLKSGKRYYVQVRTYKKIGKTVKRSAWSAKKSVKAK